MTPAEQLAHKRAEAIALIQEHAPKRLQQSLTDLLRPAIALNVERADDDAIAVGASKFGGAPDVPDGFEWPTWNDTPLGFLAQINLEEVAPFDVEGVLPKRGLLSFYYELETPVWGEAEQREGWRVFFWENEKLNRETRDVVQDIKCASIKFEATWTCPLDRSDVYFPEASDLNDEEYEQLEEFDEAWTFPRAHQILGCASVIQNEPAKECEWWAVPKTSAREWLLLLQIESDDNIEAMWGDMGTLYYMIRRADLSSKRFEETWLIMQCS